MNPKDLDPLIRDLRRMLLFHYFMMVGFCIVGALNIMFGMRAILLHDQPFFGGFLIGIAVVCGCLFCSTVTMQTATNQDLNKVRKLRDEFMQ